MVEMMNIPELQDQLTKLKIFVNDSQICNILGMDKGQFSRKKKKQTDLQPKHLSKIEEKFGIKLINVDRKIVQTIDDKVEILYWSELPDNYKNPKIRSIWFDKEIIENAWYMQADSLVIVPMIGDYLREYWYRINDRDLLIIDTNQTDISENGVFFATSRGGQKFWVREMEEFVNGDVEFRRYMEISGREVKKYSRKELINVDFKVIGRVIKNVSFKL